MAAAMMDYVPEKALQHPLLAVCALPLLAGVLLALRRMHYNLYKHPLASFPGPRAAAATTWWKTWTEALQNRSFVTVLEQLHAKYGDVVRTGPNELHFANPQAYLDIYNNKHKWDKERNLYHSFNEDETSFGYLNYRQAKDRRDVLLKLFARGPIGAAEGLIVDKINTLCAALSSYSSPSKPADLYFAYRCLTMDIITYLCFGTSIEAIKAPSFKAPIITAMDASVVVFPLFKHFEWYKNMIMGCPRSISRTISPATRGLVDLQELLESQIDELVENPSNLTHLPHQLTIYHALLDPASHADKRIPSKLSLYQESQVMMFAGADTTANALLVLSHHLLQDPEKLAKLRAEIETVWPKLGPNGAGAPDVRELERLSYLNAVIKEGLRLSSGVITGLSRVVPPEGAKIAGMEVPGKAIVSCASTFVHFNPQIFPSPHEFRPERWIGNSELDTRLVAFGKGPRACLGMNLAWMELRLITAHVFRRFDLAPAPQTPKNLLWREAFLPLYYGEHPQAVMKPAAEDS